MALASIALIALAGYFAWTNANGEEAAPDDAASSVGFVCEKCGDYFTMTARALDMALKHKDFRTSSPQLTITCQKCGQKSAVRAARCPQHGEVIKLNAGENGPSACSKCGFRGP